MAVSLIDVNPEVQTLFHQMSFNQQVADLVNAVIGNDYITLKETTAPSHTSGYGKIYVKSSDSKLYFKDDSGTEYDLTTGGGGGGGANTALSNLTTTSINESLIPQSGKTLGDIGNRWGGLYSTTGSFSGDVIISSYFYVRRTSGNPNVTNLSYSNTSTDGANYMMQRAKGADYTTFTAVQNNDVLGALQTIGAVGASTWGGVNSQIQVIATENYSPTANGCNINFQVTANTTTTRTTRFIIANDGSITAGSVSGTGSGAFYAGSGTFTGNLTIDTDTFFVDSAANRVGVLTTSTISGAHLTVGNGGAVSTNSIVAINGGSTGITATYYYQNSVLKGIIGNASGTNSLITGTAVSDLVIRNTQAILFSVDSGTTANMVLNSSGNFSIGNGTFISGIRANIGNGGSGSANEILAMNGSSTGITATYYYQNGTVKGLFGLAGASNHLINGSVQSDFNIRNSQAILFSADGGTTAHMKLLSTGDFWIKTNVLYVSAVNSRVGINNASPSYALHVSGTSGFTSTMTLTSGQNIVSSASSNSFLTPDNGSGNAVFASRSSTVIHIDYDNNQTDALLNFVANNATTLWSMTELGAVSHTIQTTTGNGYTITADSVTTGTVARILSNSTDTSSRPLLQVFNQNASATGAYPLLLNQTAVTSTNFKKYITLDSTVIWVSNGTDPNGALSGTAGDICLNCNGNAIKFCTGTTNWT